VSQENLYCVSYWNTESACFNLNVS